MKILKLIWNLLKMFIEKEQRNPTGTESDKFETLFRPYVVLHVLHFYHTLIELGFPSNYFNSISTVISSLSLLLSRGYIIDFSKTLNIILISCQLLDDDHRHPL